MANFDKFGEKLAQAGNHAARKAKELSSTAKLSVDIRTKEDQVQKMYAEIGKKYYEAHKDDADCEEQVRHVREALAAIDEMKKELGSKKGATACPRCGAQVKPGDAYCKSCGMKLSEDDIVVDAQVKDAPEEAFTEDTDKDVQQAESEAFEE